MINCCSEVPYRWQDSDAGSSDESALGIRGARILLSYTHILQIWDSPVLTAERI